GLFVEAIKAVSGGSMRPPVRRYAASDDQTMTNNRRSRAAVRKGEPPEFLHERMAPERLAVRGKCGQDALGALHIYISSFGINRRARSGVPLIDRVAQKIVVKPLPKFLAGLGVKTGDAFLEVG